ncbi:E3 ubiquitin-protein ligase UBR1-like isoform X2 [Rhincodon typus]|uniref:E3 ubiquitin-protein ligase UBR1-like isoform X2 n=1 Tax=Rhincodon typus TaxID=259920 RepID=UPI00202EBC04|nr:E3 ubiquitin-protein ligase UBR1-like isoform X2 [Rhincodon typus]
MQEQVLLRAYKECHRVLSQCFNECSQRNARKQLNTLNMCGHSISLKRYLVSQEPVSIHLPLSRLLAGLHVHLNKSGAINKLEEYVPSSEFQVEKLMDYPLRCLVLMAQVSAGMWRRNGFSLVNQVFWYRNVKLREEMFDKDIIMLQKYNYGAWYQGYLKLNYLVVLAEDRMIGTRAFDHRKRVNLSPE